MKRLFAYVGLICVLGLYSRTACSQVNILTNRYDQSRTSANLQETLLNASNVNTSTFGKLGTYAVDGVIYAQPLYAQGVMVNGAPHNVLFVATMHDVLYAFDADNVGSLPLWVLDFRDLAQGIVPPAVLVGSGDGSNASVADTFGILGTPVIDLPNNRMFLVTHTNENGTECFRLRSIDIRSGALLGSTLVTGTVPATDSAPSVSFYPPNYGQRPALAYADGQVWVTFGSRPTGDKLVPWYGWIMTYNPDTLAQTGVVTTSRTNGNSIWQSGSGPVVDSGGNVYYITGNGSGYNGVTEFPESLLKLNYSKSLNLLDWYTPDNPNGEDDYELLDQYDLDLSVNGPVLLPGTDLITFGSKSGDMYMLHSNNLGHLTPYDTQLAQYFHVGAPTPLTTYSDRIVGTTFWRSPTGGSLYVWPGLSTLHVYSLNTANATLTQTFEGTFSLPGQPATALALSANGNASGTGILWAPVVDAVASTNSVGHSGVLHAYNAEYPSQELWNSNMVPADSMGTLAKFVPPTVANGRVYIANSAALGNYGGGSVTVYGLKSNITSHLSPVVSLNSPTTSATYLVGAPITISANVSPRTGPVTSVSFVDGTTTLATVAGQTGVSAYSYTYSGAAAGSHTLTAIATDSAGYSTVSASRTINVLQSPTYSVSLSPASVVMAPGTTAKVTITVTPLSGFVGPASVKLVGVPSGVTGTVATGTPNTTFTLTLTVAPTTAPQFIPLILLTGAGGQPNSAYLPITIANTAVNTGTNTLTFSLAKPATLGTPVAFTEGQPSSALANPDFTVVSSGTTCTGSVTSSCNVQIQFSPQYSGLRRGAVELVDNSNNVIATYFMSGSGAAAAPALAGSGTFSTTTVYAPTAGVPSAEVIDAAGSTYVLDSSLKQLLKVLPNGSVAPVSIGVTLANPSGLALNAAGDLYIADTGNNRIVRLPFGSNTATALNLSGLNQPAGLAVDGTGSLFIANAGAGNILKVTRAGTQSTIATGFSSPSGVAVDASGTVFIADTVNGRIQEIQPNGSIYTVVSSLASPVDVAVDGVGDLFVSEQGTGRLLQYSTSGNGPGTGTETVLVSGMSKALGIALNGAGNAFVADAGLQGTAGRILQVGVFQSQTISVDPIPTLPAGGSAYAVSATATSGLPVTLTSNTPAVCSVSGFAVAPLAPGTCTLVATQPGNSVYAMAAPVSTSFLVTGRQSITFPAIGTQASGGTPLTLNATATSGLPVTYTSGTTSVCTVKGSSSITLLTTGICTVTASQQGDVNWTPAAPVTQSFSVQPNLLINGGFETQLTPWRFILTSPGNGTLTLSTTKFIDGSSAALLNVSAVAPYSNRVELEQDNIKLSAGTTYKVQFWAVADSTHPVDIRAEGPSPYPYYGLQAAFSVGTSWQQYTATFTATADTSLARLEFHFGTALGNVWIDDVQLFAVSASSQTITWVQQPNVLLSNSPVTLTAAASSGLPVSYVTMTPAVCTVAGTQATLLAAGTCSITATQVGNSAYSAASPVTQNFNVTLPAQAITFPVMGVQATGGVPMDPGATTTSNLPVTYSSSTPDVCTISANLVSFTSAGICSLTASQPGNANWAPAMPVTQSVSVMENLVVNGGVEGKLTPWRFILTSPGNGNVTLDTTESVDGASSAHITVTQTASYPNRVEWEQDNLPLAAGATYTVTFWAKADVPHTIAMRSEGVSPYPFYGLQTTFNIGTAWTRYTTTFTATATTSTARLEFHLDSGLGSVWIDDVQLYASSSVSQSIDWPQPGDAPYGSPIALSASASSSLPVSYTSNTPAVCSVSGSTASAVALGTCSITASQAGSGVYLAAASVTRTFNITQGSQTISFAALPNVTLGVAPFTVQATASSNLVITFSSGASSVCSVSGNTVTVLAVGSCSITASQGGSSFYAAAAPVTRTFAISSPSQTAQSITFPSIPTQGLGGVPMTLAATASSGLSITLTSNSASVCTVSDSWVTLVSAGTCSITANQPGDATYAPAEPVTQTFTVVPNVLLNAGFESGNLTPWLLTMTSPAVASGTVSNTDAIDGVNSAGITVSQAGASYLDVDLFQTGLALMAGKTYVLQFWAKAGASRTIQIDAQTGAPNWSSLGLSKTMTVGTTWTQYQFTFTPVVSATNGRIEFHLGSSAVPVSFDDMQLYPQN